ncbi:hypothetical protein BG015_009946 [Linnemannia schmuckeri]|uniref:Uncharacterized protein n=1 Tax=Linnemannia schmuckeri TaxID=64567 RepID=A0A9P5RX75_9FUNG|nr:hypothetical protein BG015_009946 [Linnemannia schmuckeri]
MPRLRRVKIGAFAASYILQNLTTVAPYITSFVYSGGFEEEYDDIYGTFLKELAGTVATCTTLQSLRLDWNMRDSSGLRTNRAPVIVWKRSKVIHHHLERITGNIIADLPLLNIRLPNFKHFDSISRVKSDEELVAALTAFLALKHLEVDIHEGANTFPQLVLQQSTTSMDPLVIWATNCALKTLIGQYRPNAWTHLFTRMPNLVFVSFRIS